MSEFQSLPFELLSNIFNKLDLKNIANLCLTSFEMASLCSNVALWKHRYLQEFNEQLPFNPNSNTLPTPFLAYLNAKLNKLKNFSLNAKNKLYLDINTIIVHSSSPDEEEKMKVVANNFESAITHYFPDLTKEELEEALTDVDITQGYPDFLEAVLIDLSFYLKRLNIMNVEGQPLFGDYGGSQHDAEIINILSKKIIRRLLSYIIEIEEIDKEIQDLENIQQRIQSNTQLSISPTGQQQQQLPLPTRQLPPPTR